MRRRSIACLLPACAALALSACATRGDALKVDHGAAPVRGTMKPYKVGGRWYEPKLQPHYNEVGTASWYGNEHQGRPTADGEIFDQRRQSAAHKTLPLPSIVEVTNLANGRKIRVRVNDRGPFVDGRIIDLSREAAKDLGFLEQGTTRVRVRYIGPAGRG